VKGVLATAPYQSSSLGMQPTNICVSHGRPSMIPNARYDELIEAHRGPTFTRAAVTRASTLRARGGFNPFVRSRDGGRPHRHRFSQPRHPGALYHRVGHRSACGTSQPALAACPLNACRARPISQGCAVSDVGASRNRSPHIGDTLQDVSVATDASCFEYTRLHSRRNFSASCREIRRERGTLKVDCWRGNVDGHSQVLRQLVEESSPRRAPCLLGRTIPAV